MQETVIRYGVRRDPTMAGYPMCEATTYVQVDADHVGAQQVPGLDGWWVATVVADALPADARVTDRTGFVVAWADWHTGQGLEVPPLPALPTETIHPSPAPTRATED